MSASETASRREEMGRRGDREEKCTMRLFLSTKFSIDVRNVCGNMSWVPEMRQWSTCVSAANPTM